MNNGDSSEKRELTARQKLRARLNAAKKRRAHRKPTKAQKAEQEEKASVVNHNGESNKVVKKMSVDEVFTSLGITNPLLKERLMVEMREGKITSLEDMTTFLTEHLGPEFKLPQSMTNVANVASQPSTRPSVDIQEGMRQAAERRRQFEESQKQRGVGNSG